METKEVFFTWKDVKRLFMRKKKRYLYFFSVSFSLVLFFYLVGPVRYQATATFKESKQDHQIKGQSEFLLSVLQSASSFSREEGVQSMFTSRTLIREVVETLGLQVEPRQFLPVRLMKNIRDSLYAELGMTVPERDLFQFSCVKSESHQPMRFFLRLIDNHSFEVLDLKKQKVGESVLGKSVDYLGSSFQLDQISVLAKPGKLYAFQINPWIDVVKKMTSQLIVKPNKKDKNMIALAFTYKKAKQSAHFVNQLMFAYQEYLKKENAEMSTLQMGYLEKRQSELMEKYEESLSTHMHFLDENLEGSGFMTLKQESEILAKPSEEYLGRLYDLDLQLSRLTSRKKEKKEKIDFEKEESFLQVKDPLEKLYAKRQEMLIDTDLQKQRVVDKDMDQLLLFLDQKKSSFEGKVPERFSSALRQGIEEIQRCSLQDPDLNRKKQLLKKKMENELEHKVFYELEGISPETVQKLFVEYNEQLDALRVQIEQLTEVKERILLPSFEIASLSGLLTDAVSLEMIQKAGQKTLELQDRANYSLKDVERIQNGLDVQKRFLLQHIQQILLLHDLKMKLIEEKITSLQQTSIHQLEVEKELIQKQLVSLKDRMKSLPGKWKRENELKMKRDLSLSVIEGLTQLSESKNIDAELFQVGSKPVDLAFVPYKPLSRLSFSFSFLVALLLSLFLFIKDFLNWLSKGRVITEGFAASMGLPVCGFVKSIKDDTEEKEAFRKICAFLKSSSKKSGSSVLLLSESSFFDFEQVAFLLALRGSKVLLIECFANPIWKASNQVGLYEYLSGPFEAPTVIKKEGFDQILSGVYHPNFTDFLCRNKFAKLVQSSVLSYDFVLLSMRGKPSDVSLAPLKDLSDLFILHVCDDPVWEDVSGWVQDKPSSLAVVFSG